MGSGYETPRRAEEDGLSTLQLPQGLITASRVTYLNRVAVIDLTTSRTDQAITEAVEASVEHGALIIVLDAINTPDPPAGFVDALVAAVQDFARVGGHVIVVNAPAELVPDLRFLGIDAASSDDLSLDPRGLPTQRQ
jgi:hypothetical protein